MRLAMAEAEMSSSMGSFSTWGDGAGMQAASVSSTIIAMVALELDPHLGALLGETATEIDVPRKNRVFCNRNLRMDSIEMIGFDMDYTLALYQQDALERLS